MHAYLLVGQGITNFQLPISNLAKKLNAKIMEFPLAKIADTRELRKITKLSFNSPTAILINNIDLATEEAVNAFLKSLEEPQENISYILTANSLAAVLPTIVSRCQVIKIANSEKRIAYSGNAEKFLELTTGEKLALIDKIKDRGEAQVFVQNSIEVSHFNLLNSVKNRSKTAMNLEILIKTLNNLKLNGNVGLQLANMVISFE
ncbi:hypothetical protein COY29_01760 [Candidatus Woesebacteria bacterium CG_4_10_14_0_2_um_filter_39_14]|uniref:DNA polymerase III subunit delta n=1 Tax=Candidatus Woesebacteria bacterium CG_4_10_14_0_2_um_filter_39_14 TaxID=1975054 RepID=A0A2M7TND4_9BACT|nr:MAG: hypothetical protein COY29_01760 [Candidatus Woesebacteria bacterium CG_4_10_14_0_2_um_filter_39_14]